MIDAVAYHSIQISLETTTPCFGDEPNIVHFQ